ncbi:unnamed protein product, partial [Tetraodon nigroviridis]
RFWENLTTPLFGTLSPPSDTTEPCVLETCALVMKIIGLEIYYIVRGRPDQTEAFYGRPGWDQSYCGDNAQLLLSVCETVKDEVLTLIDITGHLSQCDGAEDEDSMETDCPRS